LRILYISNQSSFTGGAPRSLFEFLQNIDRKKIEPFFASIFDKDLAKAIKGLGIPFFVLNPSSYSPPFFAFNSISKLFRIIKKYKIQLIHNNQSNDALYSWVPAKLSNIPLVIHHRDPSFFKRDRFLLHSVNANIAISTWQNEHNLSNKGILIHNAILLDKFHILNHSKYDKSSEKIKVGLLGRIMPYKGQDTFIKAASIVLKEYQNVQFLIVGDLKDPTSQEYINKVKDLVSELEIENSVNFLGYTPESWRIIPSFDISVIPSRKEPFGRVIIESMACGKPVVATNIWGALDIVTAETGLLVEPANPDALAQAIIELIASPQKRYDMGAAGRKRVEDLFTMDTMLNKIYQLYETLLEK